MRLFLVRHGETVDNVAGIIAGTTDSALTNHGFQQATRLGQFFNAQGVDFTHIFSSPLQRARMTADMIKLGQPEQVQSSVDVVQTTWLQEQDYGLFEGAAYRDYSPDDSRAATVESLEFMSIRLNEFIDAKVMPLVNKASTTVAVVSHGKALQALWAQLMLRFKPNRMICDRKLLVDSGSLDPMRLGPWSNTAFLEVVVTPAQGASSPPSSLPNTHVANGWNVEVKAINCQEHLRGLRRTLGGLGSAKYDQRQQTLDGFFKKPGPS